VTVRQKLDLCLRVQRLIPACEWIPTFCECEAWVETAWKRRLRFNGRSVVDGSLFVVAQG
jgi:hypothetical protein